MGGLTAIPRDPLCDPLSPEGVSFILRAMWEVIRASGDILEVHHDRRIVWYADSIEEAEAVMRDRGATSYVREEDDGYRVEVTLL